MATGTIAIAAGYTPQLGQPLAFDITTDGLKGNQKARVQIMAYQAVTEDNPDGIVYGEARPAGEDFTPLGGGSSEWLTNGGSAECVATLYYWDFHPTQTFVPLADPITFSAAG